MRRILHEQQPICLIEIHGDQGLVAIEQLEVAGYEACDMNGNSIDQSLQRRSLFHILAKTSPSVMSTSNRGNNPSGRLITIIMTTASWKFSAKAWRFCRRWLGKGRYLSKNYNDDTLAALPTSVKIEPTNLCNLRCPLCITGAGKMTRPARNMTLEEFKKIVDEIRWYASDITFWNYGEPFVNKNLLQMLRYASSFGINVAVSTNGQLIPSRAFAEQVVQSGLHRLLVDFDGATPETAAQYRRGGDLAEVIEAVKWLVEAKRELRSPTPFIEIQFIVMRHNEHEIDAARGLAWELGVDAFREKTVSIDARDPDFQQLAKEFLPSDLSKSRYELLENGSYKLKGQIQNSCSLVYSQPVINSDGSVVPCCYDSFSEHIMGNVFDENLKDIWNNQKYRDLRRQIRNDRQSITMCKYCPEGRYVIFKTKRKGECEYDE